MLFLAGLAAFIAGIVMVTQRRTVAGIVLTIIGAAILLGYITAG